MKKNYQDYVFHDGKFIGDFEGMYLNSDEIPWNQDKTAYAIFSEITLLLIKKTGVKNVLDLGCGMGYLTNRIRNETDVTEILGIDVSKTAISYAEINFPKCKFICGNVQNLSHLIELHDKKYELILCKDLIWYVINDLNSFFQDISRLATKWIYIAQSFPELTPYYGENTFPNAESVYKYVLNKGFHVDYVLIDRDSNYGYREYLHILIRLEN